MPTSPAPTNPAKSSSKAPERPDGAAGEAPAAPPSPVPSEPAVVTDGGMPVQVSATHDPSINYAFQQNGIAVLREIRLRNTRAQELRDLTVRITTEPPFALPHEIRLQSLPAGAEFRAGPVDLKLSPILLGTLSERVSGLLRIEVLAGSTEAGSHCSTIALLARNEWSGLDSLPEILAAFVLPNDPAIAPLLARAAEALRVRTGRTALNGYQDKSRQRAWDQVAAIYQALAAERFRYVNPPASFEQTGQKVRFPSEIVAHRAATCLDLALLFAACCEQAGLHPLVLMHKGHAYAGCWLAERTLNEPAIDDLQTIRKLVDLEDLSVFESIALTAETGGTLEQAELLARPHLAPAMPFRLALDVKRARGSRVLPMAIPGTESRDATEPGTAEAAPSIAPTSGLGRRIIDDDVIAGDQDSPVATPRIDQWKSRLLDLSLRNRLLNFRPTLGTVQILCPQPERVEDALSTTAELQLRPRPSVMQGRDPRDPALHLALHGEEAVSEHLAAELALGRLHTALPASEHQKRLTEIFRSARASLEENGANTLYLAVGFMEWRETEHSDRRHRAPLLLVPVELKRKSVLEGFTLRRLDEETRVNVTLLEMLRQQFHKEIPGLDPLPEDDTGVNVALVLRRIKEAVRDLAGWEVRPEVWLGQFSFSKFLLWKDLADRLDDLTRNRVVRHLVHGSGTPYANPADDIAPHDLDRLSRPDQLFCPRSADSSQLAAVLAAAAGHDFVLEGPPGTGKSQTITNIIAHCLAHGKRVLFVAEKRAALDVVHRRLKEEGLEPFCLELHSNRSGKGEVLAQFRKSLEFAGQHEPEAWAGRVAALKETRDDLNNYVQALHRPYPCGLSVYACFDHLVTKRELPTMPLEGTSVLTMSADDLEQRRASVVSLAERSAPLTPIVNHPLSPLRCTEWSGAWEERARSDRAALAGELPAAQEAIESLRSWLQRPSATATREELTTLERIADLLLKAPAAGAGLVTTPAEPLLRELDAWMLMSIECAELRRHLVDFDERRLLALQLPTLQAAWTKARGSWFLPRVLGSHRVLKALKGAAKPGPYPADETIEVALSSALRLQELKTTLAASHASGTDRLGRLWNDGEPDAEALAAARGWAAALQEQLSTLADGDLDALQKLRALLGATLAEGAAQFAPGGPIGRRLVAFRERLQALTRALDTLAATIALERPVVDAAADHLGSIAQLLRNLDTGWRDIRYWCAWQKSRRDALSLGLKVILGALERGEATPAEAPALFERSFRRALFTRALDAEPMLREFFGHEHEARIRRFGELDQRVTELTRDLVRARLAANLPQDLPDAATPKGELGILRKELAKRARHMPVRQLLGRIPGILPRLKPCVLMSPLSVAQYLEPAHEHFDVVVFDEASQIPVWDAVGAIARGRQLIVVGDPKQLPPTSFFNRTDHPEEDEDEFITESEDLESILDELLTHGLRHKRLNWHYRSQHESLIAFSNRNYYDNALFTFPSPDGGHGGVRFHRVEGASYDKGESRTNRAEAEALVAELSRRLRDPALRALSYGVVTFSQAQQDLVENLLDEQRREFPEVEAHFGDEPPVEGEPVFVKNLENVQGDERDVIFFSICYGPDAAGSVSMNFGPLNRDGGERRLNVAITRARREITVFSTLRGDDIDLTRTRARGVRDLKYFLDYAELGSSALSAVAAPEPGSTEPSEFEKLVATRLRSAGYAVRHKVGCSGYRIDLAIEDPAHPGRFILGIECDGASYRQAATARDRDLLRRMVLDRLGWRVHRLWSTDWWHDSEREMDRLLAAIAAALPPAVGAEATTTAIPVPPIADTRPE